MTKYVRHHSSLNAVIMLQRNPSVPNFVSCTKHPLYLFESDIPEGELTGFQCQQSIIFCHAYCSVM